MKRTAIRTVLTFTAAASLWVAAPALSTTPFIPEATDFTQALPAPERIGLSQARSIAGDSHEPIRFMTPEVEAPERFDLVGLDTNGKQIDFEIRTREQGHPWSDWVEPEGADPVWAGGADYVQLRSHDRLPANELHYVNVSGDGDRVSGLVNSARKAVNSAFITAAASVGVDSALAARSARSGVARKPAIIKRQAWGAEGPGGCTPRRDPDIGRVKAMAVHHTVSTNGYSEEQAAGLVLGICRYHVNANGWDDIGYNFLVDAYGNTYEGRAGGIGKAVVGAHTQGYNNQSAGVSVIGNHTKLAATKATEGALKRLLAWKLTRSGVTKATGTVRMRSGGGSANRYAKGSKIRLSRIFPHSEANFTECSGEALRSRLPNIRRKAQKRIDKFASATSNDPNGGGGSAPQPPSGGVG